MDITNQEEIWDAIAPEWNIFKNNPDERLIEFLTNTEKNSKVLDIGCASGRYFIKMEAELTGLDFSKEMLKEASKKAKELNIKFKAIQHDLTKTPLPFEDESFNKILCTATLHCIPKKENRLNLLKEIYRILKKDGNFLIKVWNRNSPRFRKKEERLIGWTDKGKRYYYFYTPEELEKQLKDSGFKIINLEHKTKEGKDKQEILVLIKK
jgi:tRNA (uracil-5-)-methyltransferase TRM9